MKHTVSQLYDAIHDRNIEEVQKLVQEINPDEFNQTPYPLLHMAAKKGVIEIFDAIIKKLPKAIDVADSGETVLQIAAERGYVKLCERILEIKPEIIMMGMGRTPLYRAAQGRHEEVCKLLIPKMSPDLIASPFEMGETLGWAAAHKMYGICELILTKAPDTINQVSWDGQTAFSLAVQYCSEDVIKLMMWPKVNKETVNKADLCGNTLVVYAAKSGNYDTCKLLIPEMNPETLNIKENVNKNTALHYIAERGKPDIALHLLWASADNTLYDSSKFFRAHDQNLIKMRKVTEKIIKEGLSEFSKYLAISKPPMNEDCINHVCEDFLALESKFFSSDEQLQIVGQYEGHAEN